MTEAAILLEVADGIAVLTLNRPAKLNAFAGDMREQLIARLDQVVARRDVRVLVVTGAGRAFCAGGDLQIMIDRQREGAGFEDICNSLGNSLAEDASAAVSAPWTWRANAQSRCAHPTCNFVFM